MNKVVLSLLTLFQLGFEVVTQCIAFQLFLFPRVEGGEVVLMNAMKVAMRRAGRVLYSSLSPWLARSCLVHTCCVPVVSKMRLRFGIVHRIRNSGVIR